MLESDLHRPRAPLRDGAADPRQMAFLAWSVGIGVILAVSVAQVFGAGFPLVLAMTVFVFAASVAVSRLPAGHPHDALGTANGVTLFRAGLAAFVAGAIAVPDIAPWVVFGAAVMAFALDGLDGYLARKQALSSPFGARFDMEVDAALAAILSIVILSRGLAGPEILILGLMRYAFVAAGFVWPWLNEALPERFRRKAICVLQIGALILILFPVFPDALRLPLSFVASLALAWSFAVDILWLKRTAA